MSSACQAELANGADWENHRLERFLDAFSALLGSGRTPLHYAALDDNASVVAELVLAGESPNAPDNQGFTPLHMAAQQYSMAAATALLDAGASVDAENQLGNAPLFVAVFNSSGRGALIELLRSHGADPLHANASGQSPLGLARLIGNYDVTQYFDDLAE